MSVAAWRVAAAHEVGKRPAGEGGHAHAAERGDSCGTSAIHRLSTSRSVSTVCMVEGYATDWCRRCRPAVPGGWGCIRTRAAAASGLFLNPPCATAVPSGVRQPARSTAGPAKDGHLAHLVPVCATRPQAPERRATMRDGAHPDSSPLLSQKHRWLLQGMSGPPSGRRGDGLVCRRAISDPGVNETLEFLEPLGIRLLGDGLLDHRKGFGVAVLLI